MKLLKLCALGLMLGAFSLSSAYAADFTAVDALIGYLMENCCDGTQVCAPGKHVFLEETPVP